MPLNGLVKVAFGCCICIMEKDWTFLSFTYESRVGVVFWCFSVKRCDFYLTSMFKKRRSQTKHKDLILGSLLLLLLSPVVGWRSLTSQETEIWWFLLYMMQNSNFFLLNLVLLLMLKTVFFFSSFHWLSIFEARDDDSPVCCVVFLKSHAIRWEHLIWLSHVKGVCHPNSRLFCLVLHIISSFIFWELGGTHK